MLRSFGCKGIRSLIKSIVSEVVWRILQGVILRLHLVSYHRSYASGRISSEKVMLNVLLALTVHFGSED
jgi:hypothetical protein